MSIIYLYDENIRKSRELPERNLQRLLDKYNQFKSLKMMQNLDKERKEEILEPFIHKFERHMGEKRQQIDGLEKISLYLDELLEKKRESESELAHIKHQYSDIQNKIDAIRTDLAKLSLLVSRDI